MAALAWLALCGPAAAASVPPELFGDWQGRIETAEPPLGEFGQPARLSLKRDGSGFSLSWKLSDQALAEVEMAPTSRPDVYGPSAKGGMLSMFGSDSPANPLAGEPLLWARAAEGGLIVYSMSIMQGGAFALDRASWKLDGDGLVLHYTRRDGASQEQAMTARLARAR